MEQTPDKALREAVQAALYGADPTQIAVRKEFIKAELERAKKLVDAGLLGGIIISELADTAGARMEMRQYGDARLLRQSAMQVLRQHATPS